MERDEKCHHPYLLPAPRSLLPAPRSLLPAPRSPLPAPRSRSLLPAPCSLLPAPRPAPAPCSLLPAHCSPQSTVRRQALPGPGLFPGIARGRVCAEARNQSVGHSQRIANPQGPHFMFGLLARADAGLSLESP